MIYARHCITCNVLRQLLLGSQHGLGLAEVLPAPPFEGVLAHLVSQTGVDPWHNAATWQDDLNMKVNSDTSRKINVTNFQDSQKLLKLSKKISILSTRANCYRKVREYVLILVQ